MDAASTSGKEKLPITNPLAQIKPSKEPKRYTLGEYLRREERSRERHEYFKR